jgi:hypothetical protein
VCGLSSWLVPSVDNTGRKLTISLSLQRGYACFLMSSVEMARELLGLGSREDSVSWQFACYSLLVTIHVWKQLPTIQGTSSKGITIFSGPQDMLTSWKYCRKFSCFSWPKGDYNTFSFHFSLYKILVCLTVWKLCHVQNVSKPIF